MQPLPDDVGPIVTLLDQLFRGRRDVYGTFTPSVKGKSDRQVKEPLTRELWEHHVHGRVPIGVFPTLKFGDRYCCAWFCYDVDDESSQEAAKIVTRKILDAAKHFEITLVPELSKGKGYHLWCFLDDVVDVWKAREIGKLLLHHVGLEEFSGGKGCELKIFPKQDKLDKSTPYGNYVYVPFFGKYVKHGRMRFLDGELEPHADQVAFLSSVQKNSVELIDSLVEANSLKPQNVTQLPGTTPAAPSASPDAPGAFFARSAAGGVLPLSDPEFSTLCHLLPSMRRAKSQPMRLGYEGWLATLVHLVPFEDGLSRAHQLSRLDSSRYDAGAVEKKWEEATKLYNSPARAGSASISERIVIGIRQGAREDVIPISPKHAIWQGGFAVRSWSSSRPSSRTSP